MSSALIKSEEAKPRNRAAVRLRGVAAAVTLGAVAFAIFAAADQGSVPPAEAAATERVVKMLAPVEVVEIALTDLSETLVIAGEVKPVRRVTISAQVAGLAGEVARVPGEAVAAGEVLLTIAPEDHRLALQSEEAALASLEVQLRTAQAALDRAARLTERGATSHAALETAEGAVDVLKAAIVAAETRVRQAEVNLGRATLRAPIPGIVAGRSVEPGQLVQAGDALFEIVDLSTVTVEAVVPLAQAARLHPGQPAAFWPPEDPAHRIAARVTRLGPQAVTGTRSVMVWLEIDNAAEGLRAGTFLKGEIELRGATDRQALPRGAIRGEGEDGTSSVLAIRDGQAVLVPVTTGPAWNGGALVEITGGLRPGDQVVALPLAGLVPGDRVQIAGN